MPEVLFSSQESQSTALIATQASLCLGGGCADGEMRYRGDPHLWALALILDLVKTRADMQPRKLDSSSINMEMRHLVVDEASPSPSFVFTPIYLATRAHSLLCFVSLKCISLDTLEEFYSLHNSTWTKIHFANSINLSKTTT